MLKNADVHVRHVILLEYKLNIFFVADKDDCDLSVIA